MNGMIEHFLEPYFTKLYEAQAWKNRPVRCQQCQEIISCDYCYCPFCGASTTRPSVIESTPPRPRDTEVVPVVGERVAHLHARIARKARDPHEAALKLVKL